MYWYVHAISTFVFTSQNWPRKPKALLVAMQFFKLPNQYFLHVLYLLNAI